MCISRMLSRCVESVFSSVFGFSLHFPGSHLNFPGSNNISSGKTIKFYGKSVPFFREVMFSAGSPEWALPGAPGL